MDPYPRRSRSPSGRTSDAWVSRDDYRRRSPDPYDTRGPPRRIRSRSPSHIDRYQPGRDHNPGLRGERNDSHRRRSNHAPTFHIDRYVPGQDDMPAPEREVPLFNPFPKPDQSSYLMPYIEYRDWWTKEQEISEERELRASGRRRPVERLRGERESQEEREKQREKLQASYDEYRENFTGKMTKVFVHQHQTEEWFKEKYDPDVRESYRQTLAGYRRESYIRWSDDLQAGTFDDFSLEGIYKGDSNGIGGVIEKEEGETTGAAEVQAVSDLVPAKGADLRDEAAMQPALLIKTLAAQIQRHKIEAFCKEHLGEGPGGYRWLSLGDPNPAKKFTRVGWVLLHPEEGDTEITNGKERSDGREEDEENGDGEMDGAETKEAPKTYVDLAFSQIDGKTIEDEVKGNFTCHFGIHSPHSAPRKKALWDLMSAPERIERDLQWATRLALKLEQELGSEVDGVNSIENHVENLRGEGRLKSASNGVTSGGKPLRILGEEAESGEDDYMEEGEEEVDSDEVDDEELLVNKKKLDLLVEYLRRVFNFCFFCVVEADSVIDLERKCSGGHLRRPRAGLTALAKTCAQATVNKEPFPLKKQKGSDDQDTKQEDGPMKTENDELPSPVAERQPRFNRRNNTHMQLQKAFSWVTRYEDMLRQVVEPETVDVKKLGARPVDEALEEDLKEFRKAEDDRYRCKIAEDCKKMFKAEHFWRKHVEKRHTEWLEGMKKELTAIASFALDPNHIPAFTVGGSAMGRNNVMPGLQRNGVLPGLPAFSNAAFPPPMGFPAMPMQPGWGNPMGNPAMAGIGPTRPGRGRFNNRAAGPYDRNANDSRAVRWRGGGGRMSPPRSAGLQRFPDALPAGGSKEATAGRSLKSYEDLDAVTGAGNGELDY